MCEYCESGIIYKTRDEAIQAAKLELEVCGGCPEHAEINADVDETDGAHTMAVDCCCCPEIIQTPFGRVIAHRKVM